MKKLIALFLICSSFVFAKESVSVNYAYVSHNEPIYEYDRAVPQYRYKNRHQRNDNNIGLDTLIGGTIGVAIGNQIGKGNGRTAAKVVGGILGASIANNMRNQKVYNSYDIYEDDYYDRYEVRDRRVLVGYRNYFTYNGQEHYKVSNRPLRKVRITNIIRY